MPLEDPAQLVLAEDLSPEVIEATLSAYGFERPQLADETIQSLAGEPPHRQEFSKILPRLLKALQHSADPEMGLLNFARFAENTALSKTGFYSKLLYDCDLIEIAILLFSTSQFLSDILIRDIRHFDWLPEAYARGTLEDGERMIGELRMEVEAFQTLDRQMAVLRRFKRREMLRIGFADIVRESHIEEITSDLSNLADTELEVALDCCLKKLKKEWGTPRCSDGREAELAIIAMGKLGGRELNYSSDIDLIFIYSEDGKVEPPPSAKRRRVSNQEYFNKISSDVVHAMTEVTELGFVFRVDTRLRPDGDHGPLARSLSGCQEYYSNTARMWEFQALIKARCAAGSEELGERFLRGVEPLVYRKYLNFDEIQSIKNLKQRIEQQAARRGQSETGVKLGTGGIRDIEFVVQFHQLLLGGQQPQIRTGNTLEALPLLAELGTLTAQDVVHLEMAYRFLRKTEHRLMTLQQLKLHTLPTDPDEIQRLAVRMGFESSEDGTAGEAFHKEYQRHTATVRQIFEHSFGKLFESERDDAYQEVNLLLSPEVSEEEIERVLSRYGFKNPKTAYQLLLHLSDEDTPLLRSPRTRQFLASLSPMLLRRIQETPLPDTVLAQFDRVVSSLGAKTMLYQWLSAEPDALSLLIEICSAGLFLVNLLVTNPGMFDDLVNSLSIGEQKDVERMEQELKLLLEGAEDPLAILTGFQNAELLRIGTRDLVEGAKILETFRSLSHLGEALLRCVIDVCWKKVSERFGEPCNEEGETIRFTVLALGKCGGEELNYYSDLDVIFAYEEEGLTSEGYFASDFFTRLVQAISHMMNDPNQYGRLFEVDVRLRPQGSKGPLACSLDYLKSYYSDEGEALLWERQAMTKLRFVAGSTELGVLIIDELQEWVYSFSLSGDELVEILDMRKRLEESVPSRNFKRGRGGIVDIEFLIQVFRLRHGAGLPSLRSPNELETLRAIEQEELLDSETCRQVGEHYTFLRKLEKRLRMVTNRATDDLPEDEGELDELAYSMGLGRHEGNLLVEKCRQVREDCRKLFEKCVSV